MLGVLCTRSKPPGRPRTPVHPSPMGRPGPDRPGHDRARSAGLSWPHPSRSGTTIGIGATHSDRRCDKIFPLRCKRFRSLVGFMGVSRDNAEFAEFFAASWDPCLRAVAASTGNMTLAEDQTAEAFARAWALWHKVSRHPAPRAWVVRTALNAGASWWHRLRKETELTGHDIAAVEGQRTSLD